MASIPVAVAFSHGPPIQKLIHAVINSHVPPTSKTLKLSFHIERRSGLPRKFKIFVTWSPHDSQENFDQIAPSHSLQCASSNQSGLTVLNANDQPGDIRSAKKMGTKLFCHNSLVIGSTHEKQNFT
jgi:hypothetical protein